MVVNEEMDVDATCSKNSRGNLLLHVIAIDRYEIGETLFIAVITDEQHDSIFIT